MFDHLGRALRWMRENRNLRQYEVAGAAGITKAMLSAYETGKQKPSLDTLEKILTALGCGLPELDEALSIFDLTGPARRPLPSPRPPRRQPSPTAPGAAGVRELLGIERPLEESEEAALAEVVDGFHKLVRYLHGSARPAPSPDGRKPNPPGTDDDDDDDD